MTRSLLAAASCLLLASVSAQAADTLNFTMKASMPSLRDAAQKDSFTVGLADKAVDTTLKIICQGATAGLITGQNESCAVTGNGALVNPANGQKLQRTQYAGGWVVKSDGFTDGTTMSVNYLALGKVAASNGKFSGSMMLSRKTRARVRAFCATPFSSGSRPRSPGLSTNGWTPSSCRTSPSLRLAFLPTRAACGTATFSIPTRPNPGSSK